MFHNLHDVHRFYFLIHITATVKDFHAYIPGAQGYAYGPNYLGGLAYSNVLGAGYRQPGGIIYYGGNLIGGRITGHDSRFTALQNWKWMHWYH